MIRSVGRGRKTRSGAFLCALALAATGCGGDSGEPSEPRIPAALAASLAETSDEIAARLEAGDGCGAAELAADLRARAEVAVDDGSVPTPLGEPLLDALARLDDDIVCEPEPEGDDDEDDEDDDDTEDSEDSGGPGESDDSNEDESRGPGDDRGEGRGDEGDSR